MGFKATVWDYEKNRSTFILVVIHQSLKLKDIFKKTRVYFQSVNLHYEIQKGTFFPAALPKRPASQESKTVPFSASKKGT